MASSKNVQILVNRSFDVFRRSLWLKRSQNLSFTCSISTASVLVATAQKQNLFNGVNDIDLAHNSSIPLETFVNRNPKNTDYFGYNKQRGYSTQYKKRNFFKRLSLVLTNRHVKAYVEDQNGNILVKASTEEFDIRKHLYKGNDVSAAANIGRALAERCLRAGLKQVSMYTTDIQKKEKYKEFRRAMTAGGIKLIEPARVVPPQTFYTGISVKKKRKGIIGMKINNSTKRKFT